MNFLSGLIFVLVAIGVFWLVLQNFMFNFTAKVGKYAGITILDINGVPTTTGVLLHGFVLGLILLFVAQCCTM